MIAEPGIEDADSLNDSPAASLANGCLASLFRFRTQIVWNMEIDVQNIDAVQK